MFTERWGAPDDVRQEADGTEAWRYDCGLRWNGFVMILVCVPIGFGIPVGHASLTLVVDQGQVIAVRSLCGGNERASAYLGFPIKDLDWCYAYTRPESGGELDPEFLDRD